MKHYELFLYKLYRMSCRIILQDGNSKRIKSILQKLYKNVPQNNSTNSHKFTPQNTYIEEAKKKIKKNYSPNNKIKKENNKKGKNMYWKIIKI